MPLHSELLSQEGRRHGLLATNKYGNILIKDKDQMGPEHTYTKTAQMEMEDRAICRTPECSDRTWRALTLISNLL